LPVLNAQVLGQDSVQRAIYRGQIHWFWGDTNRWVIRWALWDGGGGVLNFRSMEGLIRQSALICAIFMMIMAFPGLWSRA